MASSGFVGPGVPAADEVVELLRERGIDAREHRSQPTTPELLGGADLVLAMAGEHLRNAAVLEATAFPRTFLLKELVAAVERTGPRRADEPVASYLARAVPERSMHDYLRVDPALEVADPMGRRFKVFRACFAEIDDLTTRLVAALFPGQAATPDPRAG